ncbi:MAG: hypothetical protein K0R29_2035 [Pseudobdellovibrio sp.]|jgi:hypothetical protein|nr:hypothetical protein [Pseudobdellovibrio sp.]
MKTILTAMILLASTAAMSATTALQKEDTGLYPASVRLGKVYLTTPDCPPNAMCAPMVYADVTVRLAGCLDRVGTVSSKVDLNEDRSQARLNISVIAIKNKKSASVKCIAAPVKLEKVLIVGGTFAAPEVELNDLNSNGQ